jgi:hypothetical protein
MINNLKEALPQMGISEAKILYEILAEGGITRHLAIYNDYNDIAEIGSTRRFCENQVTENAYYDMLEGVTHYEMDGDNMLLLNNGMLVGIMKAVESK